MTRPSPDDIVNEARTYLGVKFAHRGRSRENGIDCIGLLWLVARKFSLLPEESDSVGYSRLPDGKLLVASFDKFLVSKTYLDPQAFREANECPTEVLQPGDIIVTSYDRPRVATHCAIVSRQHDGSIGMIHTYYNCKRVIEHSISGPWIKRLMYRYNLPGVAKPELARDYD